jgi:uncharacterized membrane protein
LNKQRFLAELRRLLVYMTEDDRDLTIRRYAEMFDDAGEAGEQAFIQSLGTPTKVAISLSRGYEPGKVIELSEPPQIQKPQESEPFPEIPWAEVPEFTLPDDFWTPEPKPEPEPDEPETEKKDPKPASPAEEEPPGRLEPSEAPVRHPVKRPMPLGIGIPLFVLGIVVVGLPLAVVFIAVILTLLSPGTAGIVAAGLAAIGALWCMTYIADALLMFGLAFLVLAVTLMLLWAGVWCDIKLVDLYVRLVRAFAGAVFGKKEA